MAKVLFVDDEPDLELLVSQKFRKEIQDGTFEFIFAQNGKEALDALNRMPNIDVVVSDVNMPEMDGLTLLDNLQTLSPRTKTIVVSAYGDSKTLRSAMNKGAFDFVTKPVDFQDLGQAIHRTLEAVKREKSSLYTYQLQLAAGFPPRVDLNYSPQEKALLWDAFQIDTRFILLLGLRVLPSSFPLEMSCGVTHGIIKSTLFEDPTLSLEALGDKLAKSFSDLKSRLILGTYQIESSVFTFQTNGPFHVHLLSSQGKSVVTPDQSTLLATGDSILLEDETKISHLSLMRI